MSNRHRFTAKELEFVEANKTLPRRDLHAMFISRFGYVGFESLRELCKRKGWRNGCSFRFKSGMAPIARKRSNARNIGLPVNQRLTAEGYVEVCIRDGRTRRFMPLHHIEWEKMHGPIPPAHVLKCKGDKTNADPSNWSLVPRAVIIRLARRNYDDAPAELKPTILAAATLAHRIQHLVGKGLPQ